MWFMYRLGLQLELPFELHLPIHRHKPISGRGKLKLRPHPYGGRFKGLLPAKFVKDCRDVNDTIQCFTAGG